MPPSPVTHDTEPRSHEATVYIDRFLALDGAQTRALAERRARFRVANDPCNPWSWRSLVKALEVTSIDELRRVMGVELVDRHAAAACSSLALAQDLGADAVYCHPAYATIRDCSPHPERRR